jgi:hypothetical protein
MLPDTAIKLTVFYPERGFAGTSMMRYGQGDERAVFWAALQALAKRGYGIQYAQARSKT